MAQQSFYTTLIEHFGLAPTEGQESLFSELELFTRKQGGKHLLVIQGYAGTGKTSVLAAYVQALTAYGVKTKLLAPTGRAAKVFSNKAGTEAHTIHKQIYRRKSKVDLSSGLDLQPNLSKNTVFVVDEASMMTLTFSCAPSSSM